VVEGVVSRRDVDPGVCLCRTSRIARLPANLTVRESDPGLSRDMSCTELTSRRNLRIDMVRFYWRADVQKKAKIMRKVKFPMELDVSELVSDR